MPRYPVDPHYTYNASSKLFKLPHIYNSSSVTQLNWEDVYNNIHIFTPTWPTPAGRAPAGRTTNKCMLSSISIHGTLFLSKGMMVLTPTAVSDPSYPVNFPISTKFSSSWRFMVIKWNPYLNQTQPTQAEIADWYYRTFVCYTSLVDETSYSHANNPSAHCNLMRMSTDYTGTFQIVADKRFWLTADKPRVEISWQIPLNERATFDPDATDALPPITPLYSIVIIPPFSYGDFDSITRSYLFNNKGSSYDHALAEMDTIVKLNFVDL